MPGGGGLKWVPVQKASEAVQHEASENKKAEGKSKKGKAEGKAAGKNEGGKAEGKAGFKAAGKGGGKAEKGGKDAKGGKERPSTREDEGNDFDSGFFYGGKDFMKGGKADKKGGRDEREKGGKGDAKGLDKGKGKGAPKGGGDFKPDFKESSKGAKGKDIGKGKGKGKEKGKEKRGRSEPDEEDVVIERRTNVNAASKRPSDAKGDHCEVHKHSGMGCAVVSFESSNSREMVMLHIEKLNNGNTPPKMTINDCTVQLRRHKDKSSQREVVTDIFVAWGHRVEKETPLSAEEIAEAFDKMLEQAQSAGPSMAEGGPAHPLATAPITAQMPRPVVPPPPNYPAVGQMLGAPRAPMPGQMQQAQMPGMPLQPPQPAPGQPAQPGQPGQMPHNVQAAALMQQHATAYYQEYIARYWMQQQVLAHHQTQQQMQQQPQAVPQAMAPGAAAPAAGAPYAAAYPGTAPAPAPCPAGGKGAEGSTLQAGAAPFSPSKPKVMKIVNPDSGDAIDILGLNFKPAKPTKNPLEIVNPSST